jgi:hypothetical protein
LIIACTPYPVYPVDEPLLQVPLSIVLNVPLHTRVMPSTLPSLDMEGFAHSIAAHMDPQEVIDDSLVLFGCNELSSMDRSSAI